MSQNRGQYNRCYCHTCHKGFYSLGIARHRAAHRDKKENCVITFSGGNTESYNYENKDKKNDS